MINYNRGYRRDARFRLLIMLTGTSKDRELSRVDRPRFRIFQPRFKRAAALQKKGAALFTRIEER